MDSRTFKTNRPCKRTSTSLGIEPGQPNGQNTLFGPRTILFLGRKTWQKILFLGRILRALLCFGSRFSAFCVRCLCFRKKLPGPRTIEVDKFQPCRLRKSVLDMKQLLGTQKLFVERSGTALQELHSHLVLYGFNSITSFKFKNILWWL